jgi:DnaK suppressor protein
LNARVTPGGREVQWNAKKLPSNEDTIRPKPNESGSVGHWHPACISSGDPDVNWGDWRKMNTHEIKAVLHAKRDALSAARQSARDEIAIEKHSEEMDDIQQSATRSLALNALTRHWEMAGLISEALERIERSTFGICAECEEEISEKRLRALPWAKYCIHCQELRDSSTADTGYAEVTLRSRFAE